MTYLLDTNIISETIKSHPNEKVITWLKTIPSQKIFLSVVTLGEIRKGVEKLADSHKKQKILFWLENELKENFANKIIAINAAVADKWGILTAKYGIPAIDGLIAASALAHNCKLITRNVKDFEQISELEVINPWNL